MGLLGRKAVAWKNMAGKGGAQLRKYECIAQGGWTGMNSH
jgi:hypothetical protein